MEGVLDASEVIRDFGGFFDGTRSRPSLIQRGRDVLASLSLEHLQRLLSAYDFTAEYEQGDDGSFTGSIVGFGIVGHAATLDELLNGFATDLAEYANEYMLDFQMHYMAPNRQHHFPFIMKVLIQPDIESVKRLINA